jgi:hypothetical protein
MDCERPCHLDCILFSAAPPASFRAIAAGIVALVAAVIGWLVFARWMILIALPSLVREPKCDVISGHLTGTPPPANS